jgi:hypothetical protein
MFDLSITLDGEDPFTVTADGRDVRAWEREFGKSWFDSEKASYADVTYLGFSAARRAGKFDGDWEAFDKACSGVRDVTGNPTKRSTRKAPTDG